MSIAFSINFSSIQDDSFILYINGVQKGGNRYCEDIFV